MTKLINSISHLKEQLIIIYNKYEYLNISINKMFLHQV